MSDDDRLERIKQRVEAPIYEDIPWLLDLVAALTAENAALTEKYETRIQETAAGLRLYRDAEIKRLTAENAAVKPKDLNAPLTRWERVFAYYVFASLTFATGVLVLVVASWVWWLFG